MSRKVSPFAKLTNEEKQLKWIEYQSIRLPYTQISQTDWQCENATAAVSEACAHSSGKQTPAAETVALPEQPPTAAPSSRPKPPREVYVYPGNGKDTAANAAPSPAATAYQQVTAYQKTRHRQYDAVIERMKQAERKTGSFQAWSK